MDARNLTINQLAQAIEKSPHILRNPIIFNDHKMVTGFDQEKMGVFISKHQRRLEQVCRCEIMNKAGFLYIPLPEAYYV